MEESKRKTKTSSSVKRSYNNKVYATVRAELPKELVTAFKDKCKENGVSIASVLKAAMEDYLK